MLTRLEVKGFKNLLDVAVDFGPFTCIAGANGIGKSNVFDAIELMSFMATETLLDATQRVRGSSGSRSGDPRDLFWDGYRNNPREIQLSAEMLVPRHIEDDLGSPVQAGATFLRYDLVLGYESSVGHGRSGRLVLLKEELRHITKKEAPQRLRFPHNAEAFRGSVVSGERRTAAYLSTSIRDGQVSIGLHSDGGRGRAQSREAVKFGRTVLSTVGTNDYPTILAAKREMESWRRLALEPSALRSSDELHEPRVLAHDGRHLAAALYRIAHDRDSRGRVDSEAVYARVANRLADLTGVDVDRIDVELDEVREIFTLFLIERGGLRIPARALSEGTLRFLALCVLLEDASFTGLICMEEPENGIHPANLPAMLSLLQDLAVDATQEPDSDNPFRQVIINTHSPGVVQLCNPNDLLLAELKTVKVDDGARARALQALPYRESWRATSGVPAFSEADVIAYLASPAEAILKLPFDLTG